jgi:hypothetical protein
MKSKIRLFLLVLLIIEFQFCTFSLYSGEVSNNYINRNHPFSKKYSIKTDRGIVAIKTAPDSIYLGWRLFREDTNGAAFNIYHSGGNGHFKRINKNPVSQATDTVISGINPAVVNSFYIVPVLGGKEFKASKIVRIAADSPVRNYISIPLKQESHFVQHAWPADLNGDGNFELVVSRLPSGEGNALIEAYSIEEGFLWRVDMGPLSVKKAGVNSGNDSPPASISGLGNVAGFRDNDNITVFDLDGDGKDEVFVRTASGVVFSDGKTLVDSSGGQYISVINGCSGNEIIRKKVPQDFVSDGPLSGHFGIAFLNGKRPSLIVKLKNREGEKGKKFNQLIAAYDLKKGKLHEKWKIKTSDVQSFHQLRILDVNQDGKDEICDGSYVIGPDGKLLYKIPGVIHGDRFHIGDIDPARPGLEGYGIQQMEGGSNPEFPWYYYDAASGKIISCGKEKDVDTGRGTVADIDPDHPGMEMWSYGGLYNVQGEKIGDVTPETNFRIWWDGDLLDEILDKTFIFKWMHQKKTSTKILSPVGIRHNSRNAPPFYGDILGDWREEVIWESTDNSELRIYTTTIPAQIKMITPLQNRAYRLCFTVKGYMQSTLPDKFPIE